MNSRFALTSVVAEVRKVRGVGDETDPHDIRGNVDESR